MKNYILQYSETRVYECVHIEAESAAEARNIFCEEYLNSNELMFMYKNEELNIKEEKK
jgi:hypothetical protein